MINTRFELYKLRRELKRNGKEYVFYRNLDNEYGEPVEDRVPVLKIKALYHETNAYKYTFTNDGTTTITEKKPMLLCALQDVNGSDLKLGDYIELVDNVYGDVKRLTFSGVTDIQDFGIIADISLEVFSDGKESYPVF